MPIESQDARLTFKDLFDFVLKHKGTKTFMGFSDEVIAGMLKRGLDEETLLYALDNDNHICGMILAVKDDEKKVLFITENLAMSISTLKLFAKIAKERLPDYTLQAVRHCKHRIFNTEKFYNKLTIQ